MNINNLVRGSERVRMEMGERECEGEGRRWVRGSGAVRSGVGERECEGEGRRWGRVGGGKGVWEL